MKRSLVVFVFAIVVASNAFAQSGAGLGNISGVVQDATGSAVPNAMVEVTNEAKGFRRVLETTSQGQFTAAALIPAPGYKLTVTKSGFAAYEATDIVVAVGQNVTLSIPLSVAATATTVDVTAAGVVVESTKTDVSQNVGERQIADLPINGRRVDQFVLLTPAVVPDGAFGTLSFRGVAGHNSFLTDGNDTTNTYFNENAGRTRISSPISQDAVQEFQVISNNFAAEYGNAMGGVVNTITKSGSNQIHGSVYWFTRNRTLNARDRYALSPTLNNNPQDKRNQVGASVGGAFVKDKLFYFFNYEGTRRDFPALASVTTANLFTSSGNFNAALASNACPNFSDPVQATPAQCATAINMLTTRNFGTVSRKVTQDLGFGRIDYRVSDRDTLSFSVSMLRWVSPHGIQGTGIVFTTGLAIGGNADSTVRDAYGKALWTRIISPTMLNEARFGWFKDRLFDDASPDFLFPGLGRADLTVNSTGNIGLPQQYPRLNPSERRFEYADNLSWSKGAHTMKFGLNIANTQDYQNQLLGGFGSYTYSTLNQYALDFSGNTTGAKNWTSYSQRFGNPVIDLHMTNYSFYGQDQYRINSRLLVNYGLRYEYSALPQPTLVNPDYPQSGHINSPKNDFSPRVGLSYGLTKDQKTLVRAGYGMFYARYQTGLINTLFANNNLLQQSVTFQAPGDINAGPVYPNFLPNTAVVPRPGVNLTIPDRNLRNPYTHQANIGIERQINSTINLNVSYVWSRGVRLYGVRDLNLPAPGSPVTFTYLDPTGAVAGTYTTPTYRGTRPDTRYRQVNQVENPGMSYYNALAIQVNKRYSRGFQASASYTWAHAIDLNQSFASNNIFFSNGPTSLFNGDFLTDKGSAANDTRHRAAISFVWDLTFTKSNSMIARYLVNNWQLSSVTTLQSSQPVNSTLNVNGNSLAFSGGASAVVTGSLNGCGCGFGRVPWQPVSNLDLDRITKVDARLAKKLPFNERFTGYLQFEAFNLFNTPYDTSRRAPEYSLNINTGVLSYISSYGTGSSTAASPDGTSARRAQASFRLTF